MWLRKGKAQSALDLSFAGAGQLDTEAEGISRVESAGSVTEEVPIKETLQELCLFYVNVVLRPVNK